MTRIGRSAGLFVVALVLTGSIGGCASDDASGDGSSAGEAAPAMEPAPQAARVKMQVDGSDTAVAAESGEVLGSDLGSADGGATSVPRIGPNVIKTADIELEVPRDEVEGAVRDSIAAAGRFGGFVLTTSMEGEGAGSASVVLRVPADAFERALGALESLGEVKEEVISGQDVGQEFVDLEARVRNLEAQETVLLRLMERAATVDDSIRVQRELQGVQLEIERLTGRLMYLRDQTEMSTIAVSFVEVGAAPSPKLGALQKAWAEAVDVAISVVSAVIVGTGFAVPVGLLLAVAYFFVRAMRPRFGPRTDPHTG